MLLFDIQDLKLPGRLVEHYESAAILAQVSDLLCQGIRRFFGAQPVTLTRENLSLLKQSSYFVSEKSDGVRMMLLILKIGDGLNLYFLDRNTKIYEVQTMDGRLSQGYPTNSIIDGELVLTSRNQGMQFIAFDCLVLRGENLTKLGFSTRLDKLSKQVFEVDGEGSISVKILEANPHLELIFKRQYPHNNIRYLLEDIIPNQAHANDGLIFTLAEGAYTIGTCSKMIKWKPPGKISLDFKLHIRSQSRTSDNKPVFRLLTWIGGKKYVYFDDLTVTDAQWKYWSLQGTVLQNRIVEVVKDDTHDKSKLQPKRSIWRFSRFRDDKPHGNHISVVKKILTSLEEAVTQDQLITATMCVEEKFIVGAQCADIRKSMLKQTLPEQSNRNAQSTFGVSTPHSLSVQVRS
ncbi:hypothetical protein BZG36_04911 [Bifiguratus adelaidae]|uniref:mRNA guanylyltransferase n=1 Tax=Bifiguratus adelaidae TaxID=1938954 RepID=A0A261XV68_9FUNG|nr:hypothetical protein BZG36_04911 [Bifiguratus adelaidae]